MSGSERKRAYDRERMRRLRADPEFAELDRQRVRRWRADNPDRVRERDSRRIRTPSGERILLPDQRTVEFARSLITDYREKQQKERETA